MSHPARTRSPAGYAVYLPACMEVYDGEARVLGDANVSLNRGVIRGVLTVCSRPKWSEVDWDGMVA